MNHHHHHTATSSPLHHGWSTLLLWLWLLWLWPSCAGIGPRGSGGGAVVTTTTTTTTGQQEQRQDEDLRIEDGDHHHRRLKKRNKKKKQQKTERSMPRLPRQESSLLPVPPIPDRPIVATNTSQSGHLFAAPVFTIQVKGPTQFPKPTWKLNQSAIPIVEPIVGLHRPNVNVIMAYAEGYALPYYMMFLESLADTGYQGDVVMAIGESRILQPEVEDYLRDYQQRHVPTRKGSKNGPNLVLYQVTLTCTPRNSKENNTDGHRELDRDGTTDVFQMCQFPNGVYGFRQAHETGDNILLLPAPDPRPGRAVATLRYEWYWIWTQRYQPHVWILLIDARDTYFQSDPFAQVPVSPPLLHSNSNKNGRGMSTGQDDKEEERKHSGSEGGLLFFFGENTVATRLGLSRKNMRWIERGYGTGTLGALKDKPTICSGSTMGEQRAIETYLRAMIREHDESHTRMTGSDQGFHNYLYYSHKLAGAPSIDRIVLWDQGHGIVNNLGALRTRPLRDWGIYNTTTHDVYQWDLTTLSPVVHQWDRDKDLHGYMVHERHKQWSYQWRRRKQVLQ